MYGSACLRAHSFVIRAHWERGWFGAGARMKMRAYLAVHAAASYLTPVAAQIGDVYA
jgi:hypothetical protein